LVHPCPNMIKLTAIERGSSEEEPSPMTIPTREYETIIPMNKSSCKRVPFCRNACEKIPDAGNLHHKEIKQPGIPDCHVQPDLQ